MIQIIDQLFTLHFNNIIYRDLKPDNIFIDHDSNIHIGDFDFAVNYSNEMTSEMTSSIGSPFFSAPESSSHNIYTFKSDIFSLGRILYFIYTGEIRERRNLLNNFGNDKIRNIYFQCIRNDPDLRPTEFLILKQIINISNEIGFNRDEILSLFSNIDLNLLYNVGLAFYEDKDINKAIDFLQISADKNHSHSQALLGYIYSLNILNVFNKDKALYYLQNAAEKGNSKAQNQLGYFYSNGVFVKKDIKKAIYYYELASNQNHSDAQYNLGRIYYEDQNERDINKSVYYLTLSSNQNNSNAQHLLGVIYHFNYNLFSFQQMNTFHKQDNNYPIAQYNIANEYFYMDKFHKQDNNYPIAQYNIAKIYFEGIYIPKDIKRSIYYLELSANQNIVQAQTMLGYIFLHSEFNICNKERGLHYLTLASNQKDADSQYSLGNLYSKGTIVEKDIKKAIYYYELASNQNHSDAQYNLGHLYYEGIDVKRDLNKAIFYLTLSAKQNNTNAQYLLGLIYFIYDKLTNRNNFEENNEELKPLDVNKSLINFVSSAEKNFHGSSFAIGVIYYEGIYIKQDYKQAIHYFKDSSSFNNLMAKNNLGIMYKNGYGVEKNINNAVVYLKEGSDADDVYSMYKYARILYFGIDQYQKNISESIELLEKTINHDFLLSLFFLYFIYFKGDEELRNKEKTKHYRSMILKSRYGKSPVVDNILKAKKFYYDPFFFLKEYDVLYLFTREKCNEYFCKYLVYGTYPCKQKKEKPNTRKNIDKNFYDGFELD